MKIKDKLSKNINKQAKDRRLLSLVLSLCLILAMVPGMTISASAAPAELAQIGSTGYTSLQTAVDAVGAGETIQLLRDITNAGTVTIPNTNAYNFTIDLNGRTLQESNANTIVHSGTGALTITDNSGADTGKVLNRGNFEKHAIYINNTGTVNLVNGTVEKNTSDSNGSAVSIVSAGKLNISGGKIISNVIAVASDSADSGSPIITVSGGEITSSGSNSCVYLKDYCFFTLKGGMITHTNSAGYAINRNGNINTFNLFYVDISSRESAIIRSSNKAMNTALINILAFKITASMTDADGTSISAISVGDINTNEKVQAYKYLRFEPMPQEATPAANVDYASEKLTGLTASGSYAVGSDNKTADPSGKIDIIDNWFGTTIDLVKKGDSISVIDSDPQSITLAARPAAPATATFDVTQPTADSATATIDGITTTMQYAIDSGITWMDGTGASVGSLSPGTLQIRLKATASAPSSESLSITIVAYSAPPSPPSGGGSRSDSGTPVTVDGKTENMGIESKKGDSTTVTVDREQLSENIANAKEGSSVMVTVGENGKATASLMVKNIKEMAEKDMTFTVKTGNIAYILEPAAIDMSVFEEAFPGVDLSKIPFEVSISKSSARVEGENLILSPVEFTVTATYNGRTVSVDTFNSYVDREIEVTKAQAGKITTAVLVNPDGSLRHVPTKIVERDGKYYVVVSSRSNSVYAFIQNEKSFADVAGKWYEQTVKEMAGRKIISGRTSSTFDGDASISRAEFVAILVRALGLPTAGTSSFTGVSAASWYGSSVAIAADYGLIEGKGANLFDTNAKISRQEAMLMLQKSASLTDFKGASSSLDMFADGSKVSSWAKDAAAWNVGSGLIQGSNGKLNPTENITRAESAAIILRLLQKAELVDPAK